MRKLILCLIAIILFIPVKECSAETTIDYWKEKALKHAAEHSCIPEDFLKDLDLTVRYWGDEYGQDSVIIEFQYFSFSEPMFAVEYLRGEFFQCSCALYGEEEFNKGKQYYETVKDAAVTTEEWIKLYGPVELWDVETNAAFCDKFNYCYFPAPKQTGFGDYGGLQYWPYFYPSSKAITPDEALEISNNILREHFHVDDEGLAALRNGMYCTGEMSDYPERYTITYYVSDEYWNRHLADGQKNKERLIEKYNVILRASDGLCIMAAYEESQEEYGEYWEEHDNRDTSAQLQYYQRTKWSEVYEYKIDEYGNIIVEQIKPLLED